MSASMIEEVPSLMTIVRLELEPIWRGFRPAIERKKGVKRGERGGKEVEETPLVSSKVETTRRSKAICLTTVAFVIYGLT